MGAFPTPSSSRCKHAANVKNPWLIIADEQVRRDTPLKQLDLSAGDKGQPDPADHKAQRCQLQHDCLARLRAENRLYYLASNDTALENIVLKLRDELSELRRSAERQQKRLALAVGEAGGPSSTCVPAYKRYPW